MTMNQELPPFHLAIKVKNLASARQFYGELFGCPEGRSDDTWVDFDFFGHQLVCHVSETYPGVGNTQPNPVDSNPVDSNSVDSNSVDSNPVDGHDVPIPHFGVVLEIDAWQALAQKLQQSGTRFVIEPYTRFEGQPGEQSTMFLLDPSGNAIEFKAFRDIAGQLFAK